MRLITNQPNRIIPKQLTQYSHHSFNQFDRRPLAIYRSRRVSLQNHRLLHHIDVYPQIYAHHDEKKHQVGHRPKDEITPAKDGRQLGAQIQTANAVPAQTRHGAHEHRDTPHEDDQEGHPTFGEVTVHLPVHHRDVSLQGDHKKVGKRCREAYVEQTLPKKVDLYRQFVRHFSGVEHEIHVSDAGEEIRGRQVGEEIVERVVKPPVGDHRRDDQGISR